MTPMENYELWLKNLSDEDPLKEELLNIKGNEKEIVDRFYKTITFGTAGLRGILGAGSNRMNTLTVGRATEGIANYILKSKEDVNRGVVFAYDCRHNSKEFAYLAASILVAKGIKVYLFPSLRPTPELSYLVRQLRTISGVNMTASHNPKEYNGYKVYWKDGAQISGEISKGMSKEIEALSLFKRPKTMDLKEAEDKGLLVWLGEDMDKKFLDYVKSMSMIPESELDKSISFVYTPLNGAGSIPMKTIISDYGYKECHIVKEQENPDPDFTTVGYPNPEYHEAFLLAEKLAKKVSAELIIATDPDSDRMAVEIRDDKGEYLQLNGNQTGALIISHMARSLKKAGKLKDNSFMVKSIVTSDMGKTICSDYGIKTYEALTGFKNICGRIPDLQKQGYNFFFAYEESVGCAPGEEIRDKDGVTAGFLMLELAASLKKEGKTLYEYLNELFKRYGYFKEHPYSLVLEGEEGQKKIDSIMDKFRNGKLNNFGKFKVEKVIDYINGYEDIPASNVLRFFIDEGTWFAVRPSGTEPKLKFYFYTKKSSKKEADETIEKLSAEVLKYTE